MATDTERLIFLLEANTKTLESAMARAEKTSARRMAAMESRAALMEKRLQASFSKGGNAIANVISATAVAAVLRGTANLADAYTNLQNQTKIYTKNAEDAAAATKFVIDTAADARVGLEELTRVFAAGSRAVQDFGGTASDVEALTEVIAKSAATANAGPQALAGALNQLAQALPAARVEAEEFNSVIDGAFGVAQAAANGLDEAAGSVSKLQQIVRDGGLSGSQLLRALLSQLPAVRKQFEETTPTIAGSFEVLKTRLIEFIGGADDAAQATENISKFIIGLADNVELLADASRVFIGEMAKIAGVAVPIAAVATAVVAVNAALRAYATLSAAVAIANLGTAASTTALAAATTAFTASMGRLLAVSRAFILSPLGLAITAVGLAIAFATTKTMEKMEADRQAKKAEDERTQATEEYEAAAIAAANSDGEAKKAAEAAADAARKGAVASLEKAAADRERAGAALEAARAELILANQRARQQAGSDLEYALNGGQGNFANQADKKRALFAFADAELEAQRAQDIIDNLKAEIERIDKVRKGGGVAAVPVSQKPKKERAGASEADKAERLALRAAKEALQIRKDNLEYEIKLAEFRGLNTDALRDELAIIQRADDLAGRGVPTQKGLAKATAEVATVRALINEERARELALIEAANQAEIESLKNNFEKARALEDQKEIADRADRYEAAGLERAAARAKAERDVADLRNTQADAAATELRLEEDRNAVNRLIAEGKFAQAEAAARILEINARTIELEAKGVQNARERATATQDELDAIREKEREMAKADARIEREIELLRLRGLDREADKRQRGLDAQNQARGDARAQGRDYNPADAKVILEETERAELEGKLRDTWRGAVRAAFSGDFKDFLSNVFSKAMDKAADNFADALFDLMKKAGDQANNTGINNGGGGNGIIAMALKALPFIFGGGKQSGGSVRSGTSYLVGENGPEMFTPGANGHITPNVGRKSGVGSLTINVNARDAVLASKLREDMVAAVAYGVQVGQLQDQRRTEITSRYGGR